MEKIEEKRVKVTIDELLAKVESIMKATNCDKAHVLAEVYQIVLNVYLDGYKDSAEQSSKFLRTLLKKK